MAWVRGRRESNLAEKVLRCPLLGAQINSAVSLAGIWAGEGSAQELVESLQQMGKGRARQRGCTERVSEDPSWFLTAPFSQSSWTEDKT